MRSAVCYFSQTGNTKQIADQLAQTFNSDVIEIEPEENYGGFLASVAKVVKDRITKHEAKLKTTPQDLTEYDVIFLGFPVWAGTMPEFVQEFVKESKIGNKRVIPFVTAAGTGKESAYQTILDLLPEATVSDYFFTSKKDKTNYYSWINNLKQKLEN